MLYEVITIVPPPGVVPAPAGRSRWGRGRLLRAARARLGWLPAAVVAFSLAGAVSAFVLPRHVFMIGLRTGHDRNNFV